MGRVNKKLDKDRMFSLRLPKEFYDEYQQYCYENLYTVALRLRRLMEADLERWKAIQRKKELNKY